MPRDRFLETFVLQSRTLDYASTAFPAYRFALPEVITEDWLASVDWHKDFHRDHVLHQPLTAYVVLKLLTGGAKEPALKLPSDECLLDTCVTHILDFNETNYIRDFLLSCGLKPDSEWLTDKPISRMLWRCFFIETAYLAAVFHDIGYPRQYIGLLESKLDDGSAPAAWAKAAIGSTLAQLPERLLYVAMGGYRTPDMSARRTRSERLHEQTEYALTKTHGLPGALEFLHLNDATRVFPQGSQNPICQLCIEWAATAIMMHDMAKVYWGKGRSTGTPENPHLRIHAHVDPLSALIVLADTLQDFGRCASNFAPDLPPGKVQLGYEASCDGCTLHIDAAGKGAIHYTMCSEPALAHKRQHLPEERRTLFDSPHGYLDLSAWGLTELTMTAGPSADWQHV